MSKNKGLLLCSFVLLLACKISPYQEGKRLYTAYCANCHMEDGLGLKGLIPPLAKADYLSSHKAQIPCIIRHGLKGEIIVNGKKYTTEMTGIQELNTVQINNIINYVFHSWGNELEESNIKDTEGYMKKCQ